MPITSTGLASGVDIQSIVSQLVALERAPLAPLQTQATKFQSKISVFGTLSSMMNSLGELGTKLADPNAFKAVKGSSSTSDAVGITVASVGLLLAGNFSAMQRPCGTSKLEAVPSSAANLGDRVADERFPARVAAIAEKVAAANDQQTVHALFQQGVAALGAQLAPELLGAHPERQLHAAGDRCTADGSDHRFTQVQSRGPHGPQGPRPLMTLPGVSPAIQALVASLHAAHT